MIAEQPQDLDYEEDVAKLKRVWDEIKGPKGTNKASLNTSKPALNASQTAASTNLHNKKPKNSK